MRLIKGKTYRRIVPQWEDPDDDEQQQMPALEWMSVPRRNGRPMCVQTILPEATETWLTWLDFFEARKK
jgi:hypothetical protein